MTWSSSRSELPAQLRAGVAELLAAPRRLWRGRESAQHSPERRTSRSARFLGCAARTAALAVVAQQALPVPAAGPEHLHRRGRGAHGGAVEAERGEAVSEVDIIYPPSSSVETKAREARILRRGRERGAAAAEASPELRKASSRPEVHQLPDHVRPRAAEGLDELVPHALGGERRPRAARTRASASSVRGSMSKPSWAEKRMVRSIRSASSSKRRSGSPTQRSSRALEVGPAAEGVGDHPRRRPWPWRSR